MSQWEKVLNRTFKGIELTELEMTCGACPSQWDAVDAEGHYVYINFEDGRLIVSVDNIEIYCGRYGTGDSHGWNTKQMLFQTGFVFAGDTVPGDSTF